MAMILLMLREHVVINPAGPNRVVLPKNLMREVILPAVIADVKVCVAQKRYQENQDVLGNMICQYQMAVDHEDRMMRIVDILKHLETAVVWVPCQVNCAEVDVAKFTQAQKGDQVVLENDMRMKPDILKGPNDKLYFLQKKKHQKNIEKFFLDTDVFYPVFQDDPETCRM